MMYDAIIWDPGHGGLPVGSDNVRDYPTPGKRYTHTDVSPPFTYLEGVGNRVQASMAMVMVRGLGILNFSTVDQCYVDWCPSEDGRSLSHRDISLEQRVIFADSVHKWLRTQGMSSCFISPHGNAVGNTSVGPSQSARGISVYTSPGQTASDAIATSIYRAFEGDPNLGIPVRKGDMSDGDPDHESAFYVLKHTDMPAVLIEGGFFTNLLDAQRMASREGAYALAKGMFEGLRPFLRTPGTAIRGGLDLSRWLRKS